MVAHSFSPRICKSLCIQGQPDLPSEFQDSHDWYIEKSCLKRRGERGGREGGREKGRDRVIELGGREGRKEKKKETLYVCVYIMCVYARPYVSTYAHVPQNTYVGQRRTSGISHCPLPCLRQSFVCIYVYQTSFPESFQGNSSIDSHLSVDGISDIISTFVCLMDIWTQVFMLGQWQILYTESHLTNL